jgi:hypothetical protein
MLKKITAMIFYREQNTSSLKEIADPLTHSACVFTT